MSHENEIRDVLAELTGAIHDKSARRVIALLSDDAVTFDLAPPLRMGPEASRDPARYEDWFATWESPIGSEPHDLRVEIGGDVACAYGLQHMTGKKRGGEEVDLWFRATACFRRERGRWRITHLHNSVPFAMDGSGKALLDLEPQETR
jgi:ketosteroid isomerase-like protein